MGVEDDRDFESDCVWVLSANVCEISDILCWDLIELGDVGMWVHVR